MPYTVPNQRVVNVHRERAVSNFLGILNENWQYAARDLGAHALMLYLYLASNADHFQLALSPTAIRNTIGMPPQTYRDQFEKLVMKGYLVQTGGNVYEFYERPQMVQQQNKEVTSDVFENTKTDDVFTPVVLSSTAENIEINNINRINNSINTEKIMEGTKQVSYLPSKPEENKFVF